MKEEEIDVIMRACVILHNMIIEDECDNYKLAFDYDVEQESAPLLTVSHERYPCYKTYFQRTTVICDPQTHARLQADLMEKIMKYGNKVVAANRDNHKTMYLYFVFSSFVSFVFHCSKSL